MKELRQAAGLLGRNWKGLLTFCVVMRVLSSALYPLLYRLLIAQALALSGYRYLTAENFHGFLSGPAALPAALLIALGFALGALLENGGILYFIDRSRQGKEAALWEAVLFAGRQALRAFRKGNRRILPVVLILTPMLHLTTIINMAGSYPIPAGVRRLFQNGWGYAAAGTTLPLWLFLRWMFVLFYYELDGCSGKEAMEKSRMLGKRTRTFRSFVPMLKIQLFLAACYLAVLITGLALSAAVQGLFSLQGAMVSSFQVLYIVVTVAGLDALLLPFTLACIARQFYEGKRQTGEMLPGVPALTIRGARRKRRIYLIETAALLLSLAAGALYLAGRSRGQFLLRIEHLRTLEVTAHRGACMSAPENTMAAFRLAAQQGADWIELDVQESRDGRIFVMHDTGFLRTTGVDKMAWELDWEAISRLDAGSFFSPEYAGEPVPLLEEVLAFAKEEGVRLNIELKPSGHEKNLAGGVMDLVEEMGFEDQCVITSQSYEVISRVRERSDRVKTVYVMGLAYGAINALNAADAFSIRSTSISRSLVHDLHNRGHEVYAWTVDSRNNINRMINLGVDNIITNNVPLAIEIINNSRTNGLIVELLKMIRDLF